MKKLLSLLLIILVVSIMPNVYANDYGIRELIPSDKKTSINGEHFLYKNMKYENGKFSFDFIRNKHFEDLHATISIGLFDAEKKNIGTVNYCDEGKVIASKKSIKDVTINVSDYKMMKGTSSKDIKYYAVFDENLTCKQMDYSDYYGLKLEKIGVVQENTVNKNSDPTILIYVLIAVGLVIVLFVVLNVVGGGMDDMNGDDTRKAYKKMTEENLMLRKKKEKAEASKQKAEEKKAVEQGEVVEEKKEEKDNSFADLLLDNSNNEVKENKEETDLENMFK